MSGRKRKAEDLEADEAKAEAELAATIAAAEAAPADEKVTGLGSGTASIYFKVPGISPPPWENYAEHPKVGEKPLVLAYFAIRGLGEVPRLLLAEAGAAYEHIAITGGETQANSLEWRTRSPNGLLPMMSGLGVPRSAPLSESSAIIRFLARKYGMAGADELEAARIDTLFETAKDLADKKAHITNEDEGSSGLSEVQLPTTLAKRVEEMLNDMAPAKDDSAVFNYGQIQLLQFLLSCDEVTPGCVAKLSPALEEFRKTAAARPRIAAYLASPMHFPPTRKELGDVEGGYAYPEPVPRRDFIK